MVPKLSSFLTTRPYLGWKNTTHCGWASICKKCHSAHCQQWCFQTSLSCLNKSSHSLCTMFQSRCESLWQFQLFWGQNKRRTQYNESETLKERLISQHQEILNQCREESMPPPPTTASRADYLEYSVPSKHSPKRRQGGRVMEVRVEPQQEGGGSTRTSWSFPTTKMVTYKGFG